MGFLPDWLRRVPSGVVVVDRRGRVLWRLGTGELRDPPDDSHGRTVVPDMDALTGLRTSRAFRRSVEREVALLERGGPPACVAVLDLDNFKVLNDRFGHPAGDRVLCDVAGVLEDNARAGDEVGRVGGEEFGVLLPHTSVGDAVPMLTRTLDDISTQVKDPDGESVTASVGVARLDPEVRTVDEILRRADSAMHYAKTRRRGGIAVARKGMFARLREEFNDLEAAATTDQRTGLPNAAQFERDWTRLHEQVAGDDHGYGLVIVDIDRFHHYNRTYGLRAGNTALRAVATAVDEAVPEGSAYRYGGEEFAVLLEEVSGPDEVAAMGQAIVAGVRQLERVHEDRSDGPDVVTVTAAGTLVTGDDERQAAFDRADHALVLGKGQGRNRYVPAVPSENLGHS